MHIDTLGNCPSTLLADPMSVDGDSFRGYLEATADAGFDAVSLWAFHLMFAGPHATAAVRESGLQVRAVEAAIGWSGGPGDAVVAEADGLVATAVDLGAGIVGAACLGPIDDPAAAADGLAMVAAQAAAADKIVALEFLPWTGVPSFAAANALIEASGAPNATILIDTFHWTRQEGGPDLETLRSVPGDRVAYVQLCEPAAAPHVDLETEAMHERQVPGAGLVDYDTLWAALDEIGSDPFVAAEVFNDGLVARGPAEMARVVHDACRAVLPSLLP